MGPEAAASVCHRDLTRSDRQLLFGLDCPDHVVWSGWEAGGEYHRTLLVQNVSDHTIKFNYKLPQSKYFTMAFPEPIKLMAGMSTPLQVTFRPVKLLPYSDEVQLITEDGTISVPITAYVPQAQVEMPVQLDFGFCAVNEVIIHKFYVHNVGDLPVSLAWKMPSLFLVEPVRCVDLRPGKKCEFEASFTPSEAAVFTGSAICSLSTGSNMIMRVTAIGKFPYLSVESTAVDHGKVLVGATSASSVKLANQSLVPANFSVYDDLPKDDQVFRLSPRSGCIPPGETLDLKLVYTPRFPGAASTVHYTIKTPGGNLISLEQTGSALGATVAITDRYLRFGDLLLGSSMRKVFVLENHSSVSVPFTTLTPGHGVFTVAPAMGVLRPYLSVQCVVTFCPVYACNYWKRLSIVLENTEPLDIDLYGTGYSTVARPPPLEIEHIDSFLSRAGEGGPLLPPAQAEESHYPNSPCASVPPSIFGYHSWDVIFHGQDVSGALAMSAGVLDFPSTTPTCEPLAQTVSVTNNLPFVLTVGVHAPASVACGGSRKRPAAWKIIPEVFDVGPGESVSISVAFTPPSAGEYFTDQIEVVAFVKYMRNFRLCVEGGETPPFCTSFIAQGDSLLGHGVNMAPQVKVSTRAICFPPCALGGTSHATLSVTNSGSTPVQFKAVTAELPPTFAIQPAAGILPPGTTFVLAAQFCPEGLPRATGSVMILLNGNEQTSPVVMFEGRGYMTTVSMEPSAGLLCKPTCVGASSSRDVTLQNHSRLPVAYAWVIPPELERTFTMEPVTGMLRGCGSVTVRCVFAPCSGGPHRASASCLLRGGTSVEECTAFSEEAVALTAAGQQAWQHDDLLQLQLSGVTADALLKIEPEQVDFRDVVVGEESAVAFELRNCSGGSVRYRLNALIDGKAVALRSTTGEDRAAAGDMETAIDATPACGVIAARATVTVDLSLTVRASRAVEATIVCQYGALAATSEPNDAAACQQQVKCTVLACSAFPALELLDVQCDQLPNSTLWDMLHARELNTELASAVTSHEAWILDQEQNHGMDLRDVLSHLQPHKLNFGIIPLGSKRTVKVCFRNSSRLPARWQMGGSDLPDLELENWVEPSRPRNDEEKLAEFILEAKIFQYHPHSGTLQPGETCTLTMTYTGEALGAHSLPVQLYVTHGRRLRLDLVGVCAPHTEQVAHLPGATMPGLDGELQLRPVRVASPRPPLQMFRIQNAGPATMYWQLELEPLQTLKAKYFGHEVLALVGPSSGTCAPGSVVALNWLFDPIVAERHEVWVPVRIGTGAEARTSMLRVSGDGCQQQPPAELLVRVPQHSPQLGCIILQSPALRLLEPCIELGVTVPHGVLRVLAVLESTSNRDVAFEWHAGELSGTGASEGCISFEPESGVVYPGEKLACLVTYRAGAERQWFEAEVALVVAEGHEESESEDVAVTEAEQPCGADVEPAAEEVLAQHPEPARAQQRQNNSGSEGVAWGASPPAAQAARQPSLRRQASARTVAGGLWEEGHVVHVKVTGAVLGGDHAADRSEGPLRTRGWPNLPPLAAPSGGGHEEAGAGNGAAGAGDSAAGADAAAAQCVFQILRDALREVMSGYLDAADVATEHSSQAASAAPNLGTGRDAGPDKGACLVPQPRHVVEDVRSASVERMSDDGQNAATVPMAGEEEPGGLDVLEKMAAQPHAVAFVEYVFERMIFGLMQEVVAPSELQSEGS
eukprot:jgi/Ulvmu1/7470/UM037_0013.1